MPCRTLRRNNIKKKRTSVGNRIFIKSPMRPLLRQKKSSLSAFGAKKVPLVLSDRQNVLSHARMKREGHTSETPYAISFAATEDANIQQK